MTRKLAALLAVTALAIAACGDSGEAVTTTEPGGTVPPTTNAPEPDGLAGTKWVAISFGLDGADDAVLPTAVPTIEFSEDGSQISGTTGCNSYFGSVTVGPDGAISFGQMGMTEMACLDDGVMDQEQRFLEALARIDRWVPDDDGASLEASDGTAVIGLVAPAAAPDLPLSGAWRLTTFIDGEVASSVLAGTEVTLTLDTATGDVAGHAGCNGYSGSMEIDVVSETGAGASFTMGPVATTLMACEPDVMDQETKFHSALGAATTMVVDGGLLTIATDDGRALVFEPAAG